MHAIANNPQYVLLWNCRLSTQFLEATTPAILARQNEAYGNIFVTKVNLDGAPTVFTVHLLVISIWDMCHNFLPITNS